MDLSIKKKDPLEPSSKKLYVIKRNGKQQDVLYDKITERIKELIFVEPQLSDYLDASFITQKVVNGIYSGITTTEIDELVAQTCAYLSTEHPDYGILAGRVSISNLEKETPSLFSEVVELCHRYVNPKTNQPSPLYSDEVYKIVMENKDQLNEVVDYKRDYNFDYFGFKVLERSYLLRLNGHIIERPQHLFLRVALGIHKKDIKAAVETYQYLSQGYFIHATPTLFNASTNHPQLSSCFLLSMKEDSIEGIYDTLKRCALISKYAGGIGLSVNCIRAKNTHIRGTNGTSNGLTPMLKVFNDTARYVDQGGGKRKGSFACYLEPWHADIHDFLNLKKNTGKEESRARDLFYALWIPDLFMKRVEEDGQWSLFCPHETPGLNDTWGEEFEELYVKYEKEGKAKATIRAQDLWFSILESQIETGTPYMLFKDACNRKSNQKNAGTIRCSNLCTEVVQYTDENEVAVCNLASLALPKYVTKEGTFDHDLLFKMAVVVTKNLNKVIDQNYYPIPEAEYSNKKRRPVGLGVQGLADVFIALRYPWQSKEASQLNREIFETIYYAALVASKDLAKEHGPYEAYEGSPMSKGQFQFDLWEEEAKERYEQRKAEAKKKKIKFEEVYVSPVKLSGRWDWEGLRGEIKKYGVRNSLLLAPMPTASTSQILGNNECIEPYTSNIYSRRVLAGEFTVLNKRLLLDLMELGLWNNELKNKILSENGSVQNIPEVPQELKAIYKTVWELPMRTLVDMAAERGVYVDQSQSFNCFLAQPNFQKMTSMFFYAWKKGLKTGMYYLRTRPAADAIKFTVDQDLIKKTTPSKIEEKTKDSKKEVGSGSQEGAACPIGCDSCGA